MGARGGPFIAAAWMASILNVVDEQPALSAVRRKMRGVGSQHLRAWTKLAPTALDAGVELARIHWIQ